MKVAAPTQPHYLYRCYDAAGRLLYIGCTSEPRRRLAAHRAGRGHGASPWLGVCMARHEIDADVYAGRDAGREAEAEAIRTEQPLFNLHHHVGHIYWKSHVAEYLVEQGHLKLALETACSCWRDTREVGQFDPWCPAHVEQATAVVAELAPILEAHLLAAVAEAETALLARVAPIIEGGAA